MKWMKSISRLNEWVVRIECLPEGKSKVQPTFAIPYPEKFKKVKLKKVKRSETYTTKLFSISLIQDGKRFSSKNLKIEWNKDNKRYEWHPGKKDTENLGGSFYSLDLCHDRVIAKGIRSYDPMKGMNAYLCYPARILTLLHQHLKKKLGRHPSGEELWNKWNNFLDGRESEILDNRDAELLKTLRAVRQYPPGFLSRTGVSIFLDDSYLWNPDREWIENQQISESQILYFVYYGNDFKKGISLLKDLLGSPPPLPEWAMGIWFSCYRKMGEKAFRKLKEDFDKHRLPLDVIVVDTDWHKYFWHGFDWNKRLFPEPRRFARWLRRHRLHAVFNVHPQYIPQKDSRLPQFIKETKVKEIYLDEESAPHPFHKGCLAVDLFDKNAALAYFRIFHKPIEQAGCDIWWIDGALNDNQGRESTTWLNYIYFRYANQSPDKETSVVLSRGYGLGAHRSMILFTGDTYSQWSVLEQEVIMTPMASNCLIAYVSHDIGGFIPGSPDWKINKPPDDLYIRWVQFGCLSPIMRFHSNHGIREPWRFKKETLHIVRNFLQFRTCLKPYLMNLVETAQKTGVGLCRPMYYEFPEDEEAYKFKKQYMLGESMLVAPVTSEDSLVTIWFPQGIWYHCFTEQIIKGPAVITEKVPLNIMPVYIRGGHLIPYTIQKFPARRREKEIVCSYTPGKTLLCEEMGIKMTQ